MLVLLLAATGCYSYAPVPVPAAEPGQVVRVHLSQPRTVPVAVRSVHEVRRVDGEFVGRDADSLVIWAHALTTSDGSSWIDRGAPVPVAQAWIERIERKRFSPGRSAAFAGVAALAVFLIDRGLASWGGGSGGPGGGTPVPR